MSRPGLNQVNETNEEHMIANDYFKFNNQQKSLG